MILENIEKYYEKGYDLNCSETILYAASAEYGLNLSKETFKTMAGFGGGMAVETVCGALTGAIAVLGIMYTKERAHENTRMKTLTEELYNRFVEKLGTENCGRLKLNYRTEESRCSAMVKIAGEILDDIVNREEV